jgi:ubiquinone biosynthesis protein
MKNDVLFYLYSRDSFFHADMHPNNIFVSREHPQDPLFINIDYDIVGILNKEDKRCLAENFIDFLTEIAAKSLSCMQILVGYQPILTLLTLKWPQRMVCEPIFQKPLEDISFGNVLQHFRKARRFNMVVQPQLVLLH